MEKKKKGDLKEERVRASLDVLVVSTVLVERGGGFQTGGGRKRERGGGFFLRTTLQDSAIYTPSAPSW